MNESNIKEAITEAERFLVKAKEALARYKVEKYPGFPSPINSACKRASLDLTRSLAKMRNKH